jgi:hypothetical protein
MSLETHEVLRWAESRQLPYLKSTPSELAVYREPYNALRTTAELLSQWQQIGFSIHCLWFDGFYTLETSRSILAVLGRCRNLQSVTLPWTTLRHFDAREWRELLCGTQLSCLVLTAIDLKEAQTADERNCVDHRPLYDGNVSFANLRRLRIVGNTNFKPITDEDLFVMAASARNLRELHITGISSVSTAGKNTLPAHKYLTADFPSQASCLSLKHLECILRS